MPACRRSALALLVAAGLSACAGLAGPRTVVFEPAEIERLLARQFPVERRVLEVFDVSLGAPGVRLIADRGRLGAVMALRVRDRLLGASWQGRIDFDAGLRWQAADQTVRLAEVRVQELTFDAAGPRPLAERLGAVLVERELEGLAIYRLSAERAALLQQRGLVAQAVTVTPRGVEVTFVPAAR